MASANDNFAVVIQVVGGSLMRIPRGKGLHKKSGAHFEGRKTLGTNGEQDSGVLSITHESPAGAVDQLVGKPGMDFLSPPLAAGDSPKCSSLPSLGSRHGPGLPPASEHFETVAYEMLDKAPTSPKSKRGAEVRMAHRLPRKNPPGTNAASSVYFEDSLAALTLTSASVGQRSRSHDCLRRKALLRPATAGYGSKSAPNSPPQLARMPHTSAVSCQSRGSAAKETEETGRSGSYPSSLPSPSGSPSLRRRLEDAHGRHNSVNAAARASPVNFKAVPAFSSNSAPSTPPQVTKASHLIQPAFHHVTELTREEDTARRSSFPNLSANKLLVCPRILKKKLETADQTASGARMLIDEHRRHRPDSAKTAGMPPKSLSVALDEVKNCRYLRIVRKV